MAVNALVCANYTVRFFLSIFVGEHFDVLGLFALGWLSPTGNGETVCDAPVLSYLRSLKSAIYKLLLSTCWCGVKLFCGFDQVEG